MDLKYGGIADVLMPNSRSYLAERVWSYIMSDKDAKDYMAGVPDEYGMKINPWYSTDAKANPSGVAFSMPNLSFPKSDPIEKPDTTVSGGLNQSGAINLVTWRPYLQDLEAGALSTLTGSSYELGTWDVNKTPPAFGKSGRSPLGFRKVLALTTTASAARFQTFQVSLKNPAGNFVAPSLSSLNAASKAMTPSDNNSGVYEFDFGSKEAKSASAAYPLTVAIYAALNPLQTDSAARLAYANLIRFAVTKGQNPGTNTGDLPNGYAPLTKAFAAQSLDAAKAIEEGISPLAVVDIGNGGSEPVPEPTQMPQVFIAAGETPENPKTPLTAASMPVVFSLFLCSLMFYALIRKRIARV
jgi:hypothetical protein